MTTPRDCSCCEGISVKTPIAIANRPGLPAIKYRIGTHATFFESLIAQLSIAGLLPRAPSAATNSTAISRVSRKGRQLVDGTVPEHLLRNLLTTRDKSDPAIALLDSWAIVADLLTFYQERLANEGFLRTAQERRSLDELSRLVGYQLRPGVSSTVYLAFEIDESFKESDVTIPAGTASRSIPIPGSSELPQIFETSRPLIARYDWNALKPRQTKPTHLTPETLFDLDRLYLQGLGLRIQSNDWLAFDFDGKQPVELRQVAAVVSENEQQRTRIEFHKDLLTADSLIANVKSLVGDFQNALLTPPVPLNPAFQNDIADSKLSDLATTAAANAKTRRLAGTDHDFYYFTYKHLLNSKQDSNQGCHIRCHTLKIKEWGALARELLKPTGNDLLTTKDVISLYRDRHKEIAEQNQKRIDTITTTQKDMKDTPEGEQKIARWNQLVKMALWNGTFHASNVQRPYLICAQGPKKLGDDDVVTNKMLVVPGQQEPPRLKILPVLVAGLEVGTDEIPLSEIEATPADLLKKLQELKVTDVSDSEGSRWLRIAITSEDEVQILGMTMQEFFVKKPDDLILRNETEKTIIQAGEDFRIDPDFSLSADSAVADYEVSLQAFPAQSGKFESHLTGKFELKANRIVVKADADSRQVTLGEIAAAVREIAFKWKLGVKHAWIQVVLQRKAADGEISSVGAALRELIVQEDENKYLALRLRLAELHGQINNAANAESAGKAFIAAEPEYKDASNRLLDGFKKIDLEVPATGLKKEFPKVVEKSNAARNWTFASSSPDAGIPALQKECQQLLKQIDVKALKSIRRKAKQLPEGFQEKSSTKASAIETWTTIANELRGEIKSEIDTLLPKLTGDLLPASNSFEETREKLEGVGARFENRCKQLDGLVSGLGKNILIELASRRADVSNRLQTVQESHDNSFRSASTELTAKIHCRLLSVVREVGDLNVDKDDSKKLPSLQERLAALSLEIGPVKSASDPGLAADAAPETLAAMYQTLRGVDVAAANDLSLIADGWDRLIKRIEPLDGPERPVDQRKRDLTRLSNLIRELRNLSPGTDFLGQFSGDLSDLFQPESDVISQLFGRLDPRNRRIFAGMLRAYRVAREGGWPKVYAFRSTAKTYGWNAPDTERVWTIDDLSKRLQSGNKCLQGDSADDCRKKLEASLQRLSADNTIRIANSSQNVKARLLLGDRPDAEASNRMFLDGSFDRTGHGSVVGIFRGAPENTPPKVLRVLDATIRPRSVYGLHGESTRLKLSGDWWNPSNGVAVPGKVNDFTVLRTTRVLCDAEELKLAEEPLADVLPVATELATNEVVLDGPALDLQTGKEIIIEGPRFIAEDSSAVMTRELAEIAAVRHEIDSKGDVPGDRYVTHLTLTRPLQFQYRRTKTVIRANVVTATHGESQREVLGGGDGAQEFPEFALKKSEVSHLPAPTPAGVIPAITVRVNDVQWSAGETFKDAKLGTREYISRIDNQGQTLVQFGDGRQGTRLPTGRENVRAEYRTGLGVKGNVAAGQISQVVGAPLGVKGVINPLPARDGADPEPAASAREHVPLAVSAMERLVSVQDFADFARSFAGIGGATAKMMQRTVRVTVTGMTPEPIQEDGPLLRNLQQAFARFGDPSQQFTVHIRQAVFLILQARIRISADREWEKVEPAIRGAVLATFGYDRAKFGRDLLLSDAFTAIQNVEGVEYVDIEVFDYVGEGEIRWLAEILKNRKLRQRIVVRPARIASDSQEAEERGVDIKKEVSKKNLASRTPSAAVSVGESNRLHIDEDAPQFRAAQLAFISRDIPDTLILEQIR